MFPNPADRLTGRQRDVLAQLEAHWRREGPAPTLDEICRAMGLRSRGSLHKHVDRLVAAGLVERPQGSKRGLQPGPALVHPAVGHEPPILPALPCLGRIAAGAPLEVFDVPDQLDVPAFLRSPGECFVLRVKGDSMIDDGIHDGDWLVIERRDCARDGEIVVALVDGNEATLKRIEQTADACVLHPANADMAPMRYAPDRVQIQGILVGQMRRYGN